MACVLTLFPVYLMLFSTSCFTTINGVFSEQSPMAISTKRMEKLTRLRSYFHDTLDGTNPTAIRIAGPSKRSFGTTMMIDDPLTEGPKTRSKLVGRGQGIYAIALNMTLACCLWEMPIVGATGVFRYARGYALAKTFSFNQKTGDAVVEYNVSVLHF
nr:dirigent protein 23 [Quercus suber]